MVKTNVGKKIYVIQTYIINEVQELNGLSSNQCFAYFFSIVKYLPGSSNCSRVGEESNVSREAR